MIHPVPGPEIVNRILQWNARWISPDLPGAGGAETALVQGFLARGGPNYLHRTAVIARALMSEKKVQPVVLLSDPRVDADLVKLYESYGISRFVYLSERRDFGWFVRGVGLLWIAFVWGLLNFGKLLRNPFAVKFGGIVVGDLMYDGLLRHLKVYSLRSRPIWRLGREGWMYLFRVLRLFHRTRTIVGLIAPRYAVVTHYQYPEYGLLARLSLKHGATLVATTDIDLHLVHPGEIPDNVVTYHGLMALTGQRLIEQISPQERCALSREGHEYLLQRFSAACDERDTNLAFRDRNRYSREQVASLYGGPSRPIYVVMSHIFSDASHCQFSNAFLDYHDWFSETLRFAGTCSGIWWLIKPHPAAFIYKEQGIVEQMVSRLDCPHVRLAPADMGTQSLLDVADVIISLSGTAGLEFSGMGKPVVLAGRPYYAGRGFTYDCADRREYFRLLGSPSMIAPPSEAQIFEARVWANVLQKVGFKRKGAINQEVFDRVWGGQGVEPDAGKAWELFAERVGRFDPAQDPHYQAALEVLSRAGVVRA